MSRDHVYLPNDIEAMLRRAIEQFARSSDHATVSSKDLVLVAKGHLRELPADEQCRIMSAVVTDSAVAARLREHAAALEAAQARGRPGALCWPWWVAAM